MQRIAAAEVALPGATPPDDGLPHLATVTEQEQAALKELDGKFSPGRGALWTEAALVRGRLLLDLGRAPEAVSTFQGLLDGKLDARVRFLAREGLGYAYEAQGKLAEAGSTFSQLGDDASSAGLEISTRTARCTTRGGLRSCEATRRTPCGSITRCSKSSPPPRCATRSRTASPRSK